MFLSSRSPINTESRTTGSVEMKRNKPIQQPLKEDGVTYLCVEDVQITDRKIGKSIGRPAGGQSSGGEKVQLMRMVGHVRQKILDIPEATPIVQDKISTGIAGLF